MLAYAANRPQFAGRRQSPRTLLFIAAAHVAAVAIIITAKTDLPQKIVRTPIAVDFIPDQKPPPPKPQSVKPPLPSATQSEATRPLPQVTLPPVSVPNVDTTPQLPTIGQLLGSGTQPVPTAEPQPVPLPAPTAARLLTPPSELRPPYPASKELAGEEATLTLRLSIDERGRVVQVDAVSNADRTFLDAARRYLIAHWRYQPATRGGHAVASSLTINLRFELD